MKHILAVDDELGTRESIKAIFSEVVYTWTVRPKAEGTETADAGK